MAKYILHHFVKVATEFTPEAFGRLTTFGPQFQLPVGKQGRHVSYQVCECCCGEGTVSRVDDLRNGRIISCGCAQVIHGCHNKPETGYKCWESMLHRCRSEDEPLYHGKGITVWPEWEETNGKGFTAFITHIGPRPSLKHSIDRYPNKNGNYEPGNVRWATQKEQANNTNRNVDIDFQGRTQTLAQWAEELGINAATLHSRVVLRGWPVERAFTECANSKNTKLEYNGIAKTYGQWEVETGIKGDTLQHRIAAGWSIKRALTTPLKKKTPAR